jgi:hypothetical protein
MDEYFDDSYERTWGQDEVSEPGMEGTWTPEDLAAPDSWTIRDFDDVVPTWAVGPR